ncbi:hypothetical protein RHSIM_Rhsim07G0088200 [Rhododendron simsii]|uniref:Uncharacterized protein n=1 Tax=Rhododendron simsii TaxID=118357 RepID=A0A834GSC5_RHOSS|nr:hypothetical protein RHSIM_Rhsim07G0088200 [Rhododendron simsii]
MTTLLSRPDVCPEFDVNRTIPSLEDLNKGTNANLETPCLPSRARVLTMNKMISGVAAAAAIGESFRGTIRPMPKRGHVKSRMASNAFHSIASVLSKTSSQIHHTKKAI